MRDAGLGSWTARRASMSPHRVALVHGDELITYTGLADHAARAAHALRGLGVRRGDRVAYLGPNHPAFLELLFGTAQLGAIFVPLNTRLAAPELSYILADCGADVLLHAGGPALPVRRAISLDTDFRDLLSRVDPAPLDEPVSLDETALLMYTSGTTGRPKGVQLTHGNLTWNTVNLLIDLDLRADEVTLVSAPMFHVAALNQTVLPTFLKGGRSLLVDSFDPVRALELIARHGVTFMFGVPTMFARLADTPGWADADLSTVRNMIVGGAPVPTSLIEAYRQRGLTFLEGYGLTETSPGALFLRADDAATHAGSAGTPVFFADVQLSDATGGRPPPGEYGEVIVHGPNVMAGYWNRPEDTAAVLSPDGWLRSGDLAVTDEDGYFYIRDRLKDMFISGGENVYPAEVEEALYAHPAVAECAVIGVPDARWGEVGRAFVVLRPGARATPEELLLALDGRLARFKIPKSVALVETLPRTGSGKVLKSQLREGGTR